MVRDGEQGCRNDIRALHDGVWHGNPHHSDEELPPCFSHVDQIATYEQECRLVERIYHLLGLGVQVLEIDKVEGYHQQDEYTLEIVQLLAAGCAGHL